MPYKLESITDIPEAVVKNSDGTILVLPDEDKGEMDEKLEEVGRITKPYPTRIPSEEVNPAFDETFWDAIIEKVSNLEPIDLVTKPIPAILGGAEILALGVGDMAGVISGLGAAGKDAVIDVLGDKLSGKRPLVEILSDNPIMDEFISRLPDSVTKHREYVYKYLAPRTESGKALEGMLGMAFGELAELGEGAGDSILQAAIEKGASPEVAAGLATVARIVPEGLVMLAGLKIGKKAGLYDKLESTWADALLRNAEGKSLNIFDPRFRVKFPEIGVEVEAKMRALATEYEALSKQGMRTEIEDARFTKIESELDILSASFFKLEGSNARTYQTPDELLQLAEERGMPAPNMERVQEIMERPSITDLQKASIDLVERQKRATSPVEAAELMEEAGVVNKLIEEVQKTTKMEVILEDNAGSLSIRSGLEEIVAAKMLGQKRVPVRIDYKNLTKDRQNNFSKAVDLVHEKSRALRNLLAEKGKKSLGTLFAEASWDAQYGMKKKLVEEGKDAGRDVVMMYELMAGSSTKARVFVEEAVDRIYSGLNESNTVTLNDMIDSLHVIQIDSNKGVGTIEHAGGLTKVHHEAKLGTLLDTLGKTKYRELRARARDYSDTNKMLLKALFDEELISRESYNLMKYLDYRKIEYLDLIDPKAETLLPKRVSVRDSGVYFLEKGRRAPTTLDSRDLLIDHALRVYSRIFKNRANRELAKFAETVPDNSLARNIESPEKAPKHSIPVQYYVQGKPKHIALDPIFAEQWVAASPEMRTFTREFLRWASGTPIVKATTVGLNPSFFVTDFPRNVTHMFLSSTKSAKGVKLYSSFLPMRIAQQGIDMIQVAKDAWTYGPLFKKFVDQGGAPQFLAHIGQGELLASSSRELIAHSRSSFRRTKAFLAKMNEWSELEMRLGVMNRAQKAGLSETEAAYEGRRIIDYAQAGRAGHVANQFIPFLNPAMQATRTGVRGMVEAPLESAWMHAQMMGGAGMLYLSNYLVNSEATMQITDEHMATGLNFVLPSRYAGTSADGDIVHPYIHIKVDNLFMPAIGYTNLLMRKAVEGRDPNNMSLSILRATIPISPSGSIPPTLDAIYKYLGNADLWFGRSVSDYYGKVEPYAEYTPETGRHPTEPFYVEAARWLHNMNPSLNISPDRSQAVVDTFLADHPFSSAWGHQYTNPWRDVPDYDMRASTAEKIASLPGVNRILKIGRHGANLFKDLEEFRLREPSAEKLLNDQLDAVVSKGGTVEDIKSFISSDQVPINEKERLANRAVSEIMVRKAINSTNMKFMPTVQWWRTAGQSVRGKDRADAFYKYWVMLPDSAYRENMLNLALKLTDSSVGFKFANEEFIQEFMRLRREQGDELPDKIGFGSVPLNFIRDFVK